MAKKRGEVPMPKRTKEEVQQMATLLQEDLSLPEAKYVHADDAKVSVWLKWDTNEGVKAKSRFNAIGSDNFPMGGLVKTVALGVQHDRIKTTGQNGDKQVVPMTTEIVEAAFEEYRRFQASLPVNREAAANNYRRTANFVLSVKEKAKELDLSVAEEKVRFAHRIIQHNALVQKRLDWRRVTDLLDEAASLVQKTSADNLIAQIRDLGEKSGQTPEAIETAVTNATSGPIESHFGALMSLVHSLRNAAYDVDQIAQKRQNRRNESSGISNRPNNGGNRRPGNSGRPRRSLQW